MDEKHGKIISGVGGLYTVLTRDGSYVRCKARGSFRHSGVSPYPGDNVTVTVTENGDAVISEVGERKNFISRPPCANIDKLFVTVAAADPAPAYITSDKLILAAEYYGSETVVIVTKSDLDPDKAREIRNVYEKSGYRVFVTSSESGHGVEELKKFVDSEIEGCVAAFAGESGVGKSSILNALFPELKLTTGAVSRKISRGKHTTRAVTLFPLGEKPSPDGAFLADTPGFGIFDLSSTDDLFKEDLPELFPEFRGLTTQCRYTRCTHLKEEGCAILKAVEEDSIAPQRHESYVTVYNELKLLHPFRKTKK